MQENYDAEAEAQAGNTGSRAEEEVRRVLLSMISSYERRDLDGLIACLAPDIRTVGTGVNHRPVGLEANRRFYELDFETRWGVARLRTVSMFIQVHGDVAWVESDVALSFEVDGVTQPLPGGRLVQIFRRAGAGAAYPWLVVHHHISVPWQVQGEEQGLPREELEARNRDLEKKIAERTAELKRSLEELKRTQAQLIQQEKLASLGALTAGIAHEIKNPLNFVNNFAALAAELAEELQGELRQDRDRRLADVEDVIDDLRTNAEKIEEHGRRADSIVRSMLEHSRGGRGEREAVNVSEFVSEYVGLAYHGMRAQHPDFNCAVERDLDPSASEMKVVPQEIGRVLVNLLNNAFYAVHKRAAAGDDGYAPGVLVTTRRASGSVEIAVSDNGSGIPPEIVEKIFEPFFTTKPSGEGTGLGLSLSHEIVTHEHGGTLSVDSVEGEGTTFTIALPTSRETAPAQGRDPGQTL